MCDWSEALLAAVSRQFIAPYAAAKEPKWTSTHAISCAQTSESKLSVIAVTHAKAAEPAWHQNFKDCGVCLPFNSSQVLQSSDVIDQA